MAVAEVFFDVAESFRDDPFGHRTREVAHENYRPSGGVGVPVLAASTRAEFALDQAHSITELGATITAPCSGDDAPSYGKRVCLGVSSFGEGNLERAGLDGAAVGAVNFKAQGPNIALVTGVELPCLGSCIPAAAQVAGGNYEIAVVGAGDCDGAVGGRDVDVDHFVSPGFVFRLRPFLNR